ncbi:MAG: FHA domain-containing protein [Planctomycetes bacterium]|nr:FHA domain-containing protein [Planctomycetota bacterium]
MAAPHFVVTWKFEKKANRDRPEQTIERSRVTLGSRPTADLHVADRLVPLEALEFVFDGRRLQLEVKHSLAGVFVNGAPVEGAGPVPHGATVQVGHAIVDVSIDEANSACKLAIGEKYLTATVAGLAKKAATPFALEDDSPQEQRWGKSHVLSRWNWIAAFAGLLLLASFPLAKDTEAVNRGPLLAAHALGADAKTGPGAAKRPTECSDCHSPFASNYAAACAKCHEAFDSAKHHPYARAAETTCQGCHPEHRGADADVMPPTDLVAGGWQRTCATCHAGDDFEKRATDAAAAPDLASKARDHADAPVQRWLHVDGFSHADHRVAKPRRASLVGGAKRPDGDVPLPCAKCHAKRGSGDVPGAAASSDFALVAYTKCLECHAEWRVDVHGREQGGVHCFQCHAKTDDVSKIAKDIRTTEIPVSGSLYDVMPRKHDFAKDDCRSCHVETKTAVQTAKPEKKAFRHDHHLRTVDPGKGGGLALAASCIACHHAVAESSSLAGLGSALAAATLDSCKDCHVEGAPKPVAGTGTRTVVDMFHSVHTVEPGTSGGGTLRALSGRETLAQGCVSCHVPAAGDAPMKLREGTADCSACHKGHESLGGGKCALCHVDRASAANRDAKDALVYRFNEAGIFAREKAVVKTTAPVHRFEHFSRGHTKDAADASGAGCAKCHDPKAVDAAQRVVDVAWPGPLDPSCLACHVRERYHR